MSEGQVLEGSQPGLSVGEIILRVCDSTGENPDSHRLRNRVKRSANSILLDIQLQDPGRRRTIVYDAEFTTIAGTAEYDVRRPVEDGGFGWDNCFRVIRLIPDSASGLEWECIDAPTHRNRGSIDSSPGFPGSWVALDDTRVKLVPAPDSVISGVGDYYQDIPQITEDDQKVDWPRAWDSVLMAGVMFEETRAQDGDNVQKWMANYGIYQERLAKLKTMERATPRRSRTMVNQRNLRNRRVFAAGNDVDIRGR